MGSAKKKVLKSMGSAKKKVLKTMGSVKNKVLKSMGSVKNKVSNASSNGKSSNGSKNIGDIIRKLSLTSPKTQVVVKKLLAEKIKQRKTGKGTSESFEKFKKATLASLKSSKNSSKSKKNPKSSSKKGSPKSSSKKGTPQNSAMKVASPKNSAMKVASPKNSAMKVASPKNSAMKVASPKNSAITGTSPKNDSKKGSPKNSAMKKKSLSKTSPEKNQQEESSKITPMKSPLSAEQRSMNHLQVPDPGPEPKSLSSPPKSLKSVSSCGAARSSPSPRTKLDMMNALKDAKDQKMSEKVTVGGMQWEIHAIMQQSVYGQIAPHIHVTNMNDKREHFNLFRLREDHGEEITEKLYDVYKKMRDHMNEKYEEEIESSRKFVRKKKNRIMEQLTVLHDYATDFLPELKASRIKPADASMIPTKGLPPVPLIRDGVRDKSCPHREAVELNDSVTVLNVGEYVTSMDLMDDLLAIGTQPLGELTQLDTASKPGPNGVQIWSVSEKKLLYTICHNGKGIRTLSFVPGSRTKQRAGILSLLSLTGTLELFVLPYRSNEEFVQLEPFWSAPINRSNLEGIPRGLLSFHVFASNNRLWILGGCSNGMINVWQVSEATPSTAATGSFGHPSRTFAVTACAWLELAETNVQEPLLFCTGDLNGMVCLWDRTSTMPMSQILVPGTGHIFIRGLRWMALDASSVYILHQSLCVWSLQENSLHDLKERKSGEEMVCGFQIDLDGQTAMASLSIWSNGTVLRAAGGSSIDGRECLQSWSFRKRPLQQKHPIDDDQVTDTDVTVPGVDMAALNRFDDQQKLLQSFFRTIKLKEGLEKANIAYLKSMRWWEDKKQKCQGNYGIEIFGNGVPELIDPVPLTAIAIETPTKAQDWRSFAGRLMAIGSAAGLVTLTMVQASHGGFPLELPKKGGRPPSLSKEKSVGRVKIEKDTEKKKKLVEKIEMDVEKEKIDSVVKIEVDEEKKENETIGAGKKKIEVMKSFAMKKKIVTGKKNLEVMKSAMKKKIIPGTKKIEVMKSSAMKKKIITGKENKMKAMKSLGKKKIVTGKENKMKAMKSSVKKKK